MLTARRAQILRLIINSYIETAVPVASEAIARRYGLSISPATVRNEMAHLEAEGYIMQPYTSAGRIPSDKGYRYYVEGLMEAVDLDEEEKLTIRHQFHQASRGLEEWLQLAAAVLAQAVHNLAVITPPLTRAARLRHVHLVAVQDVVVLLIVLLEPARLRQRLLSLDEPVAQTELDRVANRFNHLLAGLSAREMGTRLMELSPLEEQVIQAITAIMEEEEVKGYGRAYLDGLRLVLGQPEFARASKILEILDALDERNLPQFIPFQDVEPQQVSVIIGGENRQDIMRQCSVVLTRYGAATGPSGALAVLGPTRMHYDRAISTVRYIASVMDELLAAYYGAN